MPAIDDFWTQGNIAQIPTQCTQAFNYLARTTACAGVIGSAISLAAEISHCTYPGFAQLTTRGGAPEPDLAGAWTMDGSPFATTPIRMGTENFLAEDELSRSRILEGFAFSKETPLHRIVVGYAQLHRFRSPDHRYRVFCWADDPIVYPMYNTTTVSSITRLAIAVELYEVPAPEYVFETGPGGTTFLNMVAVALAAATSMLLTGTDTALKDWKSIRTTLPFTQTFAIHSLIGNATASSHPHDL